MKSDGSGLIHARLRVTEGRKMKTLVLAEHDNTELKDATLAVVGAAKLMGDEVHLLVAGANCRAVAEQAAKVGRHRQGACGGRSGLRAPCWPKTSRRSSPSLMDHHDAFVAPATTTGKNIAPRVARAARRDAGVGHPVGGRRQDLHTGRSMPAMPSPRSQSSDPKLVVTVRGTAFDKAEAEGGSAQIEEVSRPRRQRAVRVRRRGTCRE